jgi:DNA-binding response OmpR family regulator
MARILLIEDDESLGPLLCELLRDAGHDVMLVATLDEIERAVNQNAFDLALSDLVLSTPGMNREDGARSLRRRLGAIPTILVTAYGEAQAWRAMDYELEDIVLKPFDLDMLLEAIETTITGIPALQRSA